MTDLIFFPGWSFHASIFTMLTPYLSHYRLHFINLPTHHDRDTLTSLAQTLPDHAVLAGWSLGGLTAIKLCAMFPEKFSHLILLASTPKFVASDDWTGIHPGIARRFSSAARTNLTATMNDFLSQSSTPAPAIQKYLCAHSIQMHDSLLAQLDFLFATDLRDEYINLPQPKISIAGDKDAILPPTVDSEIITCAGHALPFTHTQHICQRIHTFISDNHEST